MVEDVEVVDNMKQEKGLLYYLYLCSWERDVRKSKKDFKGEYSELLAAGRTKEFPTHEDFLAAIVHNRQVAIEKCGFDKRLLNKFQKNGITTMGQVRELQERDDYHDLDYTRKQKESIGSFVYDTHLDYEERK